MLIRAFEPADAGALAALFHASVRQIGIRDYSTEQVIAWSPSQSTPEEYLRRAEGRLLIVAENSDGEPMGYAAMGPDGHYDHWYCRPDVVGTGVGSALYAALENAAKDSGLSVLTVEASEAARRLFERTGFKAEARNHFEVNGGGNPQLPNVEADWLMCRYIRFHTPQTPPMFRCPTAERPCDKRSALSHRPYQWDS